MTAYSSLWWWRQQAPLKSLKDNNFHFSARTTLGNKLNLSYRLHRYLDYFSKKWHVTFNIIRFELNLQNQMGWSTEEMPAKENRVCGILYTQADVAFTSNWGAH
jgi:hypothetical protein